MIIRNKNTGKEYNVTKSEWETINSMGFGLKYKIINANDTKIDKINIPAKIEEFQAKITAPKKIITKKDK